MRGTGQNLPEWRIEGRHLMAHGRPRTPQVAICPLPWGWVGLETQKEQQGTSPRPPLVVVTETGMGLRFSLELADAASSTALSH